MEGATMKTILASIGHQDGTQEHRPMLEGHGVDPVQAVPANSKRGSEQAQQMQQAGVARRDMRALDFGP